MIHYEAPGDDGVAVIRIDRPQRRNALDGEALSALDGALERAHRHARAAVLTGTGASFCSGADLYHLVALTPVQRARWIEQGSRLLERIAQGPTPVVAAVNGAALGGGLEVALSADIVLAAEGVPLGFPEMAWGWLPGWGGIAQAVARVGVTRARALVLGAEPVTAEAALQMGLINEVCPAPELERRARDWARRLGDRPALAMSAARRALSGRGSVDAGLLPLLMAEPRAQERLVRYREAGR